MSEARQSRWMSLAPIVVGAGCIAGGMGLLTPIFYDPTPAPPAPFTDAMFILVGVISVLGGIAGLFRRAP